MNVESKEYVTLIKLKSIEFKGKDGSNVEFKEFAILDEEGELITGTCKKTLNVESIEAGEQLRGTATFVVVPKSDKTVKLQLSQFELA